MGKRIAVWASVVIFFIVLIALGLRGKEAPKTGSEKHQAPEFTLNLLGGGQLTFPELQARPAVLNFTASW